MNKTSLYFISILLIILIGVFGYLNLKPKQSKLSLQNPNAIQTSVLSPTTSQPGGLTLSTLSQHNSQTDCWMAIEGNVYDVTRYIPAHPGGMQIIQGCGKDATTLFNSIGKHRSAAQSELTSYKIGQLLK